MLVMEEKSLTEQIEELRSKMVELGSILGLQHPEVLRTSRILDELLLEYYGSRSNT